MAQENSALIRRWFEEVWNKGRMEAIDEMASPDAIGHGQAQHDTDVGLKEFRTFCGRSSPRISRHESHHRSDDRARRQSGGSLDVDHDSHKANSWDSRRRERKRLSLALRFSGLLAARLSKAGTTGTNWVCWCRLGRCRRRILWRLRGAAHGLEDSGFVAHLMRRDDDRGPSTPSELRFAKFRLRSG